MKKILIAISVLALLTFMAGPSLAIQGQNDAVPGVDVLAPFFFVEKASGLENTYIVITEVAGAATTLHWNMYTKSSVSKKDDYMYLTGRETEALNVKGIFDLMGSSTAANYEITLNSLTYYAGYLYFDSSQIHTPSVIAWLYQIDLANGRASGVVIPAKEYAGTGYGYACNAVLRTNDADVTYEVFTPDALAYMQDLAASANGTAAATSATSFSLMSRFYFSETSAKNYLFIYSSSNLGTDTGDIHTSLWKEDETPSSVALPLYYELNVIDLSNWLDSGWTAGSFEMAWPDAGVTQTIDEVDNVELIGYNYQQVDTTANGSWNVLYEIHREASTD